jgi:hypothetical protein
MSNEGQPNRYTNALFVANKRCSTEAIFHYFFSAIAECTGEGGTPAWDPACRLICHVLADHMGVPLEFGNDSYSGYYKVKGQCEEKTDVS